MLVVPVRRKMVMRRPATLGDRFPELPRGCGPTPQVDAVRARRRVPIRARFPIDRDQPAPSPGPTPWPKPHDSRSASIACSAARHAPTETEHDGAAELAFTWDLSG